MAILKPADALTIMAEHDCEMTIESLYAWIRGGKCPFGAYSQINENLNRGGYTIFRARLLYWLECKDMNLNYNNGPMNPLVGVGKGGGL